MTDFIEIVARRARQSPWAPDVNDADFAAWQWPLIRERLAAAQTESSLLAASVELAAGSDRLATVFVAGYQGALRALLLRSGVRPETVDRNGVLCLAATEAGGARPTAIQTTLTAAGDGYVLQGAKQWTTGAGPSIGSQFLVLARRGERTLTDGKQVPDLVAVHVAAGQSGVEVTPMPPTPFIPEVPHGRPTFNAVRINQDAILPGDGYMLYLKPFRTTEDIFVLSCVAAYLLAYALRRNQRETGTLCAEALQSLAAIVERPWLDPSVHLVLAGVVETMARAATGAESLWADDRQQQMRWQRDQALLAVAGKARAQRTQAAWDLLR